MRRQRWMPTGLMILAIVLGFAAILTPWKAARGQLVQVQGRVTAVNKSDRSLTVLDGKTSEPVTLRLGRDAFEPGQSWKTLGKKPRVNIVATYNFDGSVQARRVSLL